MSCLNSLLNIPMSCACIIPHHLGEEKFAVQKCSKSLLKVPRYLCFVGSGAQDRVSLLNYGYNRDIFCRIWFVPYHSYFSPFGKMPQIFLGHLNNFDFDTPKWGFAHSTTRTSVSLCRPLEFFYSSLGKPCLYEACLSGCKRFWPLRFGEGKL